MEQRECKKCPAFIYSEDALSTGLCYGCRAPKAEQMIDTPLSPPVNELAGLRAESDLYRQAYQMIGACDISNFLAKCSLAVDYDDVVEERDRLKEQVRQLTHEKEDLRQRNEFLRHRIDVPTDALNHRLNVLKRLDKLVAFCESLEAKLLEHGDPFSGDDWQLMQEVRFALGKITKIPT
jgi:FtsZ-binding cell division protein ZapB